MRSLDFEDLGIPIILREDKQIPILDKSKFLFSNILEEAKKQPKLKRMFGNFIFENELNGIFGDLNIGKSPLAMQISNEISKGNDIFGLANEFGACDVLFYDFELNPRMHLNRYEDNSKFGNVYVKYASDIYLNNNEFNSDVIKKDIEFFEAKFVVIDNITAFLSGNSTLQQPADALNLIRNLRILKDEYNVTFLILGHITKTAERTAMSKNSIAGSKIIQNLMDGFSMLGNIDGTKYLKQIKCRNCIAYEKVLTFELNKYENGNLEFEATGWQYENDLISNPATENNKGENLEHVASYVFSTNLEMKYTQIKNALIDLGNSEKASEKIITKLSKQNIITKNSNGSYSLTKNNDAF